MHHRARCLALLALFAAVLAAPSAFAAPPAAAEPVSLDVFLDALAAGAPGVTVAADCDAPEVPLAASERAVAPVDASSSCCISRCSSDRDCDRVCGGRGTGDCVQVNSCCRECICLSV